MNDKPTVNIGGSNVNEPPWSMVKATNLFNRWSSQCTVSNLGPVEQARLLIHMMAEALKEDIGERTNGLKHLLLATNEASHSAAEITYLAKGVAGEEYLMEMAAYLKGYRAALVIMALALDLSPSILTNPQESVRIE